MLHAGFAKRMHAVILPRLEAGRDALPQSYFRNKPQSIQYRDAQGNYDWGLYALNQYTEGNGGDVAVIPITDTMSRYGYCGYGNEYIAGLLDVANRANDLKGIVLKMDTPGGTVDSIELLADAVRNCNKKVVVWTNFCASAGYFVASQADHVVIENSVSSEVGSIGVLMVYTDISKALEKAGYSVSIYRAGGSVDKALVNGIEPLSEATLADIQMSLDDSLKTFKGYVRRGRVGKLASEEVFTGKMYNKKEALSLGLADSYGSLKDAVKLVRQL